MTGVLRKEDAADACAMTLAMSSHGGIRGYLYRSEIASEQRFLGICRRAREQLIREHVGRDSAEQ